MKKVQLIKNVEINPIEVEDFRDFVEWTEFDPYDNLSRGYVRSYLARIRTYVYSMIFPLLDRDAVALRKWREEFPDSEVDIVDYPDGKYVKVKTEKHYAVSDEAKDLLEFISLFEEDNANLKSQLSSERSKVFTLRSDLEKAEQKQRELEDEIENLKSASLWDRLFKWGKNNGTIL